MKNHFYSKQVFKLAMSGLTLLSAGLTQGQNIFALTANNELSSFAASSPNTPSTSIPILGITAGQIPVGLDFRPNTGELYVLGYNSLDSSANLYTVNKTTALATKVGTSSIKLVLGNGRKVGFDFNPTVDRIRVVGASDFNYRLHPVTGAIAATDLKLSYASTDANVTKNPNVSSCGYTNSYIGTGTTVLYDFDDSLNILVRQDPPNNGTLNTVGNTGISLPVGLVSSGFDIYKEPSTLANTAYLTLNSTSVPSILYSINLTTGAATMKGSTGLTIKDIAVEIIRNTPNTLTGQLIYGIQGASNLITFDSENASYIRTLVPITGVTAGQSIVGMDARPRTKELLILGYNSTNGESMLYTLTSAGVATPIGTSPITLALGTSGFVGFDFNPTVDRIRIVGSNNVNYRLNPITGAIAATDTALAFLATDVNAGKNPFVSSAAYTNSFDGTTSTQLFVYDDSLNIFALQSPPNRGTLNTIAPAPFMVNLADPTTDLDVYYDKKTAINTAFMVTNTGTSTNDSLYVVNLTSGMVSKKGLVGMGVAVRDIAAAIDTSMATPIFDTKIESSTFNLNLYPNPINDATHVEFSLIEDSNVELNMINLQGTVIQTSGIKSYGTGTNSYTFNTSGLNNGLYVFELKVNGERKASFKAVK